MASQLAWPIAIVCVVVCVLVWFRDVRRIMRSRKSMVDSAAGQLSSCREKAVSARGDPETEAVLERSETIYRQAVELYDRTLKKPWVILPALLMGFGPIVLK